ncbi:Uncharacterised protein [Citrobacter freundii]|nr:Uncharacterised protein [Citrobacter freundii]
MVAALKALLYLAFPDLLAPVRASRFQLFRPDCKLLTEPVGRERQQIVQVL